MPSIGSLARLGITTVTRSVDVALALPRIALALERIADAADDLRRIADAAPAVKAIAGITEDVRRLLLDPRNQEDLVAARAAVMRLGEVTTTLRPLADAVAQLNAAVASLNTTVSPLQGASERLGRLVDRFPAKQTRPAPGGRVVDVE